MKKDFFLSSRRRHTRSALGNGVQKCALTILIDRQIIIGELALEQVGTVRIAYEFAEQRIGQSRIGGLAVFVGGEQLDLHPVARLEEQDRAPAERLEAVRIFGAGADIFDRWEELRVGQEGVGTG